MGRKVKDLAGQKFDKLTAIEIINDGKRQASWRCICFCGKEVIRASRHLLDKQHKKHSCGCDQAIDLTDKKFWELTVLNRVQNRNSKVRWKCICSCGREIIVTAGDLKTNKTKSCGHLKCVSQSERAFLNKLESMINEKIERQFCIHTNRGRRFYDGFIKNRNLLIEVDCEKWHLSDYKKENDRFKDMIANQNGYKMIRYQCENLQNVDKALKNVNVENIKSTIR